MKTIMVATDFSRAAGIALEYGISIAKKCDSRLFLFHSFEPPIPTSTGSIAVPAVYKLFNESKSRIKNLALRISQEHEIEVDWFTNVAYAEDGITAQATQTGANLVVMGMRGSSINQKLFGSVTTSVIRNGKFPVMVIPEESDPGGINRILFACEYGFLPSPLQLGFIRDIAGNFMAEVQVLHVDVKNPAHDALPCLEEKEKLASCMEAAMKEIPHFYKELEAAEITSGIKKGIEEYQADLLVMTPHRTGFLDLMFNRSITRKMVLDTSIPLLTLPYLKDEMENDLKGSTSPTEMETSDV